MLPINAGHCIMLSVVSAPDAAVNVLSMGSDHLLALIDLFVVNTP